jgi:hypothetical protein
VRWSVTVAEPAPLAVATVEQDVNVAAREFVAQMAQEIRVMSRHEKKELGHWAVPLTYRSAPGSPTARPVRFCRIDAARRRQRCQPISGTRPGLVAEP